LFKSALALWMILALPSLQAAALDPAVQQLIVSIAPEWDSMTGRLQCFERSGDQWRPVTNAWPVIYGKNGLAWGRGVRGTGLPGRQKVERDGRAPAGLFKLGTIYTYDSALPAGASFRFHTVGRGDAWVDDVRSPDYNRHIVIPDPVEIRHNSDPPVAGMGSAIFFHIRRGPQRPSAGCTVMAEENLLRLMRWLRVESEPHYLLLPRKEYEAKWKAWGLPAPEEMTALTR
ncbi:MAG: L,D-transpeptidase family protein, partial [Verrucomicrobiota bacterium]